MHFLWCKKRGKILSSELCEGLKPTAEEKYKMERRREGEKKKSFRYGLIIQKTFGLVWRIIHVMWRLRPLTTYSWKRYILDILHDVTKEEKFEKLPETHPELKLNFLLNKFYSDVSQLFLKICRQWRRPWACMQGTETCQSLCSFLSFSLSVIVVNLDLCKIFLLLLNFRIQFVGLHGGYCKLLMVKSVWCNMRESIFLRDW